mmetsp:Transcript_116300/g.181717  ORF Transcript_116300/g.181717 Transcript_116300/m.181717 type:complete len:1232 (+) Transcript_116300:100-3795(+)
MRRTPAQQRGTIDGNQSARSQAVSVSSLGSPYVFPRTVHGPSQVNGYFYSGVESAQGPPMHGWQQLKEGGATSSSEATARNPVMRLSAAVPPHGVTGVAATPSTSAFRGNGAVASGSITGLVARSPGPQRSLGLDRRGSTSSLDGLAEPSGLQQRAPNPGNLPELRRRGDLAAAAHGALVANMAASTGDLAAHVTGLSLPSRWEARRELLHAPSPRLVGDPEGSANAAVSSSTQPSPTMECTDATTEDDVSEVSLRKAARALRMFFSAAQVRAIASAPPAQYANIPVNCADPDKQPSDLAKSLRLALKLLSQDSPEGSRFRARLLLALASSSEKESVCSTNHGQSQALCGSIEAQVFGMQEPFEDELGAFAGFSQSRRSSVDRDMERFDDVAANALANTEDHVRGLGTSSNSFITSMVQPTEGLGGSSSSFASPTTQREGATLVDTTSASIPLRSQQAAMTSGNRYRGGSLTSVGSSVFDTVGDLLEDKLALEAESTDADLGDRLRRESDDCGDNSEDDGDLVPGGSDNEQVGSVRGSEVSTRPPSDAWEYLPAPQFQGQRQQLTQKDGVWPKGQETLAAAATAAIASNVASGQAQARSGVQVGMGGIGLSLSTATGQNASMISPARRQAVQQSPSSPRRSRRALPVWGDLKDAQSRETSRDDLQARSRGTSPQIPNGRSHLTPCRSSPSVDRIEHMGVAWANVQPRTTSGASSAARLRRSSADDRHPSSAVYPGTVGTGIDIMPLKLQNFSLQRTLQVPSKESPRRSPRKRAASNDRLGALGGSGHYQSAGSLNIPATQARDSATRTPARRTGDLGDRQGSTTRLRRDRESCHRAIVAQFQSPPEPSGSAVNGVQSPGRSRPLAHALDFYAIGKLIGKGAFGKVNVGVHKLTEELTAMKLCERKKIAEVQVRKCLMQEVSVLKKLNGHPNTIQLFEVIETATHVVLVMEFAAGGDLLRYVRQRRRLTEPCAQDLFKQLLEGIQHVHSQSIVHRDIKLENLLLDSFGCLKIADFGVAVVVKPPGRRLHEHCGTPSYIAPEILLETGYEGQPVDVWSAGIVLYAMVCGRVPFKGEHLAELKRCILRGRFQLPSHLSEKAAALLRSIIVVDPRKRCTLRHCLSHDWLAGVLNRAEAIYGKPALPYPPEAGKPDGARPLLKDDATQELLGQVAVFGFPQAYIEESLQDGRFNHATATFHLLAQQKIRRRASTMTSGELSGSIGAPSGETVAVDS